MFNFNNISIKSKLRFMILFVTVLATVIGFTVVILNDVATFHREMDSTLMLTVRLIGEFCAVPLSFQYKKETQQVLEKLRLIPWVVGAVVFDPDGNIFVRFSNKNKEFSIPAPPFGKGIEYQSSKVYVYQPITYQSDHYGAILLIADTSQLKRKIQRYILTMAGLFIGLLLFSFLLADRLQKVISQPLLYLAKVAREISLSNNYEIRVEKAGDDEIGLLYDQFNTMLQQITERERQVRTLNLELEQRVQRRTRELENAMRELESFSYSVSHDLRAPLRALDGYSLALIEDYGPQLDEQGRHFAQRIRAAAHRMGDMIDDLLRLSRVTRSELRKSAVNLSEIARELIAELQQKEPHRAVETHIADNLVVYGDRGLLRIALENLLGNAWNYSAKKELTYIEFNKREEAGRTVFYIRDKGAGFDMRFADKLFGAFQRLHRQDEFEGTGIGLATVKRIIARHYGEIWAEGEVDRGATFYFYLDVQH